MRKHFNDYLNNVIQLYTWNISRNYSRWRTKNFPTDVVLFHHTMRGPWTPSITPFAIKAETYMRLANISYKV